MAFSKIQSPILNSTGGGAPSTTATMTVSAIGTGNYFGGIFSHDSGSSLVSVTDNAGSPNTYNVSAEVTDTTNSQKYVAFWLTNIQGNPTHIILTVTPAGTFIAAVGDEFSGASTSSSNENDGVPAGNFQNAPGTGTDAITSNSTTTTVDGDLLHAFTGQAAQIALASNGTGFSTGAQMTTDYGMQSEFKTQVTHGAGTVGTFTRTPATQEVTFLITIKPPTGADVLMPQIWM